MTRPPEPEFLIQWREWRREGPPKCCHTCDYYSKAGHCESFDITPFMQYIARFEPEWQACFAINIAKTPTKQAVAFSSQAFSAWVADNEDLL